MGAIERPANCTRSRVPHVSTSGRSTVARHAAQHFDRRSLWPQVEMYDTADEIEDAALRHQIAMLHALPPEGMPADPGDRWTNHKHSLRTLLCHILTSCYTDLFPGVSTAAIKPMAAAIIGAPPPAPHRTCDRVGRPCGPSHRRCCVAAVLCAVWPLCCVAAVLCNFVCGS